MQAKHQTSGCNFTPSLLVEWYPLPINSEPLSFAAFRSFLEFFEWENSSRVWQMKVLGILDLSKNDALHDYIPKELFNCIRLQRIKISFNRCTGSIPTFIGNCALLQTLNIADNQLRGSIPAEFGRLVHLESLKLSQNALSGSIPTSLANCTSLIELFNYNNNLSGSIPSEIGHLVRLYTLIFNFNSISGSIPTSIRNYTLLFDLAGRGNNIPSTIGLTQCISYIDLSNNSLTLFNCPYTLTTIEVAFPPILPIHIWTDSTYQTTS